MSDVSVNSSGGSTSDPASMMAALDDGQKSPLDVLEDILSDAKGVSQADQVKQRAEAELNKQQLAEQEKQRQQEEFARQREQQRLEDERKIQQQLTQMKQIVHSPQEKARLEQEQEQVADHKQASEADDGLRISQLEHTKIEISE